MNKSIKKNYIYNLSYQLLIILMPLITTPYLSRTLGSEGIGIYGYTISIVTFFVLFGTLGISTFGQREIAYYQDDKIRRSQTFWSLLFIKFISMFIVTTIFIFCFTIHGEYSAYYKILIVELFSNMIDITWFFQGMEEFKKIAIRNFIVKLLSVTCIFIFIKKADDVGIYLAIYCISNLISNLSLWFKIKKYVVFTKINFKSTVKYILPMLGLFLPQIAVQVYVTLDKTMIGLILNDMNEVGFYEQAQKIIKMILSLTTSLGTVMVPRIANLHKKGNKEEISNYMQKAFNFVWFISTPLLFGICAIVNNFVPWFFGNGFNDVVILIIATSPILYAIGFNNIIGVQYLIPTGKQNIFTISVTVGAIVNFILNFILLNIFGTIGACISSVIAETSILIYQIIYIKKHNEFDVLSFYKNCKKYLISGIIMAIITYSVGLLLNPSIISIAIQIIVGVITYLGMLLILHDEFFVNYFKIYTSKIIKKVF